MALIGSPGSYQDFIQSGGLQYAIGLLAQGGGVGSSPQLAVSDLAGRLQALQPYLSADEAVATATDAVSAMSAGDFFRRGGRRTPIRDIPVQPGDERGGAASGRSGRYLYRVVCQPAGNRGNLGTTVWIDSDTQLPVEDVLDQAQRQAGELREAQPGSATVQLGIAGVTEWDCTVEAVTRSY